MNDENIDKPNNQSIDERLASVTQQINEFKTLFGEVLDLKEEISKIRSDTSEARGAINTDISAYNESNEEFKSLKSKTVKEHNLLLQRLNDLKIILNETDDNKDRINNLFSTTENICSDIENHKNIAINQIDEIKRLKQELLKLTDETKKLNQDLQVKHTNISNKCDEVSDVYKKIMNLHKDLMIDEYDEQETIKKSSINTELLSLYNDTKNELEKIQTSSSESREDITKLKSSLETEIRSLLPEAGAAGLAGAYVQAKSKYGYIPYAAKENESKIEWFVNKCTHIAKHVTPPIIYYTMFLAPLTFMMYIFYDLFQDISNESVNEKLFLFRALLTLPLAVISLFGWSSIRLSRRLYEEYNHKQRVMELYHSFKEEIDKVGDPEHKKALLTIMLKAVDDKPSLAMNKYDGGITGFISGITLPNLLMSKKDKDD